MLKLKEGTRIYLANQPVDCRKAINGLAALIVEQFEQPITDGSVYVFYNRYGDRAKCLFWDKNGFVLYQKRLERGRFKVHRIQEEECALSLQQLEWLLAGLDFRLMETFKELDYSHYF